MARCHVCNAESSGLGEIPYKASRRFSHDPKFPHLDICSDCTESVYNPEPLEFEEGEIETVES